MDRRADGRRPGRLGGGLHRPHGGAVRGVQSGRDEAGPGAVESRRLPGAGPDPAARTGLAQGDGPRGEGLPRCRFGPRGDPVAGSGVRSELLVPADRGDAGEQQPDPDPDDQAGAAAGRLGRGGAAHPLVRDLLRFGGLPLPGDEGLGVLGGRVRDRPHLGDQLLGGGPFRRVLRQAPGDERGEPWRQPGQIGLAVHHLVRHQVVAVRVERAVSRRRVHEHGSQGEDVRGRSHVAGSLELLGRHVRGSADQLPGLGPQVAVRRTRDPEVDDPYAVRSHQYVAGLEVPVHHSGPVDVAQGLGQAGGEPGQFDGVEDLFPYAFGERRRVDEQGGHPRPFGIGVGVHDGRGERSAHPPRGGDLLPEAGPELRIHRVLGVHDLDGEFQPRVGRGQMDDAHPSGTEHRFEPVLPGVLRKSHVVRAQRMHRSPPPSEPSR